MGPVAEPGVARGRTGNGSTGGRTSYATRRGYRSSPAEAAISHGRQLLDDPDPTVSARQGFNRVVAP